MIRFTVIRLIAQFVGYLVGGIPTGYLVAKAKAGIDIREHGSGNIGATNVGRVLGFRFFLLVFVLDFLKGALPVAVAFWLLGDAEPGSDRRLRLLYVPELVGFAAILGHLFPVYLGFRGGKGVATTMGVVVLLAPIPAALGLAVCAGALVWTRMVSAGSLAFALTFALAYLLSADDPISLRQAALTIFVLVVSLLILVRHASNIGRIVNGTEPRIRLPWASD